MSSKHKVRLTGMSLPLQVLVKVYVETSGAHQRYCISSECLSAIWTETADQMNVRHCHPQSPDCRCPLSNLWVGIHRKYLQGLRLTPASLLEQWGGCQEWDRGSGICPPPLTSSNQQPSSCPRLTPPRPTPASVASIRLQTHSSVDRGEGGGGCRGSGPLQCSTSARECVCVCEERRCVGVKKAKVKVLEVYLVFQTSYGQIC